MEGKLVENKGKLKWLIILAVVSELAIMMDMVDYTYILKTIGFPLTIEQEGIINWSFDCLLYTIAIFSILKFSKQKTNFSIFDYKEKPSLLNICFAAFCLLCTILLSALSWGQFRPIAELLNWVRIGGVLGGIIFFIGQYIYYILETVLFLFIIAFGQQASDILFKTKVIPWGGIFCAILWGLIHIPLHGFSAGLITTFQAVIYGIAYLLMKRNVKFAYPLIFMMFVL